jgi:ADP-ribose pyrophosphatase
MGLSDHQRGALDAYFALIADRPDLFENRLARPIIRDRGELEAYASRHDVVLGVAADTPYLLLVVDLVSISGRTGPAKSQPYLRVVSWAQLIGGVNVVVVATIGNAALGAIGNIVLVEQERHALGTTELELPRGFGEADLSGEASALRELAEETGFEGDRADLLGSTLTDSGVMDSSVSFYHVTVVRRSRARPEPGEAIKSVVQRGLGEVWTAIASGEIRDGFTLQGMALLKAKCGPG